MLSGLTRRTAAFAPRALLHRRWSSTAAPTVPTTDEPAKDPLAEFLAALPTPAPQRFAYGDVVLVRNVRTGNRRLTTALWADGKFSSETGELPHAAIVGKRPRDRVKNHKGHELALHYPTMEEYVLMAPRIATPIYPRDASAIVDLLDLPPSATVLEAGTGTGGLTLYLAAAVGPEGRVLSVDLRKAHSTHAAKFVHRFRRAALRDRVTFATGDVAELLPQLPPQSVDGVVLDLLSPWDLVADVARVLRPDASVVVYVPSITQALRVLHAVRAARAPLALEKCIEVDHREWELKPVAIKWPERRRETAAAASEGETAASEGEPAVAPEDAQEPAVTPDTPPFGDWVCRPTHRPNPHTAFLLHLRCTAIWPAESVPEQPEKPT
ncbi:hypothetical protein H9P43_009244 [Blastocladiella emersonii ATCC 22665]|nr:hypothetical protein H9P43_009244 [Blastocladiella emersonii ATCC 22665]